MANRILEANQARQKRLIALQKEEEEAYKKSVKEANEKAAKENAKKQADKKDFWGNLQNEGLDILGTAVKGTVGSFADLANNISTGWQDEEESKKRTADFLNSTGVSKLDERESFAGDVAGGVIGGITSAVPNIFSGAGKVAANLGTNLALNNSPEVQRLLDDENVSQEVKQELLSKAANPRETLTDAAQLALDMATSGKFKVGKIIKPVTSTGSKALKIAKEGAQGAGIGGAYAGIDTARDENSTVGDYAANIGGGALTGGAFSAAFGALGARGKKGKETTKVDEFAPVDDAALDSPAYLRKREKGNTVQDTVDLTDTDVPAYLRKRAKANITSDLTGGKPATEPVKQLALGAGFRKSTDVQADMEKMVAGDKTTMSDTMREVSHEELQSIHDNANKLAEQKSILETKLAATAADNPMYEKTRKQIEEIDAKITESDALINSITKDINGNPQVLDIDKAREKYLKLQSELEQSKSYEQAVIAGRAADSRGQTDQQLRDIESGTNLPNEAYDAPEHVTNSEDIMDSKFISENTNKLPQLEDIRRAGLQIYKDKQLAQNNLDRIYKESDADIDKSNLDADYNSKLESLQDIPEARRKYEEQKITDKYMQDVMDIDAKVDEARPEADKAQAIYDAVLNEEKGLVRETNSFLVNNSEVLKVVNPEKLAEVKTQLIKEKYTSDPTPTTSQTDAVLHSAVQSDADLVELSKTDPAFAAATSNRIDDAIEKASQGKEQTTGIFKGTLSQPLHIIASWGPTGKAIAQKLSNSVRASEIDQSLFVEKLTGWNKLAKKSGEGSSKDVLARVAKALDGDKEAIDSLNGNTYQIYTEAKAYFNKVAEDVSTVYGKQISDNLDAINKLDPKVNKAKIDSLNTKNLELESKIQALTSANKITDYFPHVFGDTMDNIDKAIMQLASGKNLSGQKLTNAELSKLSQKVNGIDYETQMMIARNSKYKIGKNGFLESRTGSKDYSLDFNDVMIAYNRAMGKTKFFEPTFGSVKELSEQLLPERNAYLAKVVHNMGAAPTDDLGEQLNRSMEAIFKNPNLNYTKSIKKAQNLIYTSAMGFNIGSAFRNLSQTSNTIAEVGLAHTASGMKQASDALVKDQVAYSELVRNNILTSTYGDALRGSDIKGPADKVLWGMFETTEKFNRASAYFAGKEKALSKGLSELEAEAAGRELAEKTQFKFNAVNDPINLQSPTAKALVQFQGYNIRQAKLIAGWVGDTVKNTFETKPDGTLKINPQYAAKLLRYTAAQMVFISTIGAAMGMKPEDMIPFYSDVKGGELPQSPISKIILGKGSTPGIATLISEAGQALTGDEQAQADILGDTGKFFKSTATLAIPGGSQIKKTIEGADSLTKGQSENSSGKIQFMQGGEGNLDQARALVFGKYATDSGKEWLANKMSTMSDKQTETINGLPDSEKQAYYDYYTVAKNVSSTDRSEALAAVEKAAQSGDLNKAARLGKQFNDSVSSVMADYYKKHKELPAPLEKVMNSKLYIDVQKTMDNAQE